MNNVLKVILLFFMINVASAKEYNAFDFAFTDIDGNEFRLDKYKGKVLLIVNVASKCALAPQYEGLENLYNTYKKDGLVVIGVPSNDFNQEPGTDKEIKKFSESTYKVTFPMMSKVNIKGDKAHPFYKWAETQVNVFGAPKWNFHKYIIARDGKLIEWFSSGTEPLDERLIGVLEDNLHQEK